MQDESTDGITFDEALTLLVAVIKVSGGEVLIPKDAFANGVGAGVFSFTPQPDGDIVIAWEEIDE
jgi:hypothetical protein